MNSGMKMAEMPSTGVEQAEPKHESLMHQVHSIDNINRHLSELVAKINGSDAAETHQSDPIQERIVLSEALVIAPELLRKHETQAHKLIEVLEQLLF